MLELDDIQYFLVTRTRALTARYEFLSFRDPGSGRAWPKGLVDKVGTAQSVGAHSPDAVGHHCLNLERPSRARPR